MDHIELFNKMIEYYEGDPKRIQHFTKVFEYCRLIGIDVYKRQILNLHLSRRDSYIFAWMSGLIYAVST